MTSPSDTILIDDEEESTSLEPGSSRLRTGARPDYSYQKFENMIDALVDKEGDTTPSRKRRRTETDETSVFVSVSHNFHALIFLGLIIYQENIFKKLGKTVRHKIQQLQDRTQVLQDELRQERKSHRKTQGELYQERQKRNFKCKICYEQPDRWVTISCGHMFCESCTDKLQRPKKCPICRAPITGYIECLPFAG
ncbi:hypothetical protein N7533_000724 [Penicillium manginii]|uniref:uncharacterized protein n=1 Tax=Penicillium manginii TaxID=203109 RepID=UPI002546E749|nr:uncharacterized protein N7533_000724 [Penicillium manginii]KAJ5768141.1 hypothetical protein N7533_000724 [Penicillium manginii]